MERGGRSTAKPHLLAPFQEGRSRCSRFPPLWITPQRLSFARICSQSHFHDNLIRCAFRKCHRSPFKLPAARIDGGVHAPRGMRRLAHSLAIGLSGVREHPSGALALEDEQLVAKRENLGLELGARPQQRSNRSQESQKGRARHRRHVDPARRKHQSFHRGWEFGRRSLIHHAARGASWCALLCGHLDA